MKRWIALVLAPAIGLLAASCGTSTQMAEVWQEPSYKPQPVHKVMIIGVGENTRRIKIFEDIMASHFEARKLQVVKGSSVLPADSIDIASFKKIVQGTGADIATVSRLVGMDTETSYVPGTSYYTPAAGYYGFYPYYYSSYSVVNEPGYITQYKIYKVETNVYDVRAEKLIWSGLSHTTDPANMEDGVNSMASVVVESLAKSKIIK